MKNKNFVKKDRSSICTLKRVFDKYRTVTDTQSELNRKAIEINGGECFTYNICEYCKEKRNLVATSDTPCVDALKIMRKKLKNNDIQLEKIEKAYRLNEKYSLAIINRIRGYMKNAGY